MPYKRNEAHAAEATDFTERLRRSRGMSGVCDMQDETAEMLPEQLCRRLRETYPEHYSMIEDGYRAERPVTMRINPIKGTAAQVREMLAACGVEVRSAEWYEDALIVKNGIREHSIEELPLYRRGEIYLQSLSSMLPPILLHPKAGENILDMTAAPGGKTTEMFALSEGKALITACERDTGRFERLKFNLERQGATRVNALHTDALRLDDALKFDKILLDAPCTGSGTIASGTRIRFSEEYLSRCTRLQEKLLDKALRLLRKGGTLLYSTCSVLQEEDDCIVARACKNGARLVPVELPSEIPLLPSMDGTACVCPGELYEGFYLARLTV